VGKRRVAPKPLKQAGGPNGARHSLSQVPPGLVLMYYTRCREPTVLFKQAQYTTFHDEEAPAFDRRREPCNSIVRESGRDPAFPLNEFQYVARTHKTRLYERGFYFQLGPVA